MRLVHRLLTAAAFVCLPAGIGHLSVAVAQADPQPEEAPKQVALTQRQIDGLAAAQKEIQPLEDKMTGDKPDPAMESKVTAIIKKNGFSDLSEYSAVGYSVGVVLAGVDPDTKKYVGPATIVKKQSAEVKADAKMPPKEKKEALAELNGALTSSGSGKPLPGNVDLVIKNFDNLSAGMQQDSN